MIEVFSNLYVGSEGDCGSPLTVSFAVVHACKDPCHRRAVGYTSRSLPQHHPYYLVRKEGRNLYLNMIDPDAPLFMPPLFIESLNFIQEQIQVRPVLIHCNLGGSRSPSLAMLYLAKRTEVIANGTYEEARMDFLNLYPAYSPGRGIQSYLSSNWGRFS